MFLYTIRLVSYNMYLECHVMSRQVIYSFHTWLVIAHECVTSADFELPCFPHYFICFLRFEIELVGRSHTTDEALQTDVWFESVVVG